MTTHPLHREAAGAQAGVGNAAGQPSHVARPGIAGGAAASITTQVLVIAGLLAGLWVAISPWFVTLQEPGGNAAANNLIIGLAVVVLAVFTAAGERGAISLQAASALAGVWLVITPAVLDAKQPITDAMYWSNIWAGGIITVLALSALALGWRPGTLTGRGIRLFRHRRSGQGSDRPARGPADRAW